MSDNEAAFEALRQDNQRLTGELNQQRESVQELMTLIYEAHSMTTRAVTILHSLGFDAWDPRKVYSR